MLRPLKVSKSVFFRVLTGSCTLYRNLILDRCAVTARSPETTSGQALLPRVLPSATTHMLPISADSPVLDDVKGIHTVRGVV